MCKQKVAQLPFVVGLFVEAQFSSFLPTEFVTQLYNTVISIFAARVII